jgi:HSP20 family protein
MTTLTEPVAPWLRDLNRLFSAGAGVSGFMPPADVIVGPEDVLVYMDVPGVKSDNLEIELENDTVTVRGERRFPYTDQDDRTWRRIERSFGTFERELRVPRGLDPDAIEASLEDGVLTLRIPKPEPLKPRRVEIKVGQGQGNGQRDLEGSASSSQA